jgi:inner membrane protein
MPMTVTHALVPFVAAVSFGKRPLPWRLVIASMVAATLPDLDAIWKHFLHLGSASIFAHRGASHSLFAALVIGAIASTLHRRFGVQRLTAAVVVAASTASHGLLDMMTDGGEGVAYLWPLTSERFFADWRPLHSTLVHRSHFVGEALVRIQSEIWQIVLPLTAMMLLAVGGRAAVCAVRRQSIPRS